MSRKLSWGILGTGNIAGKFAGALRNSRTGVLLAVASRAQTSADKFADQFGAERRYGNYEALLADADVEAIYIATPHPMHAEWAIKAADAHKHVLCEKPIGLNHAEAMAIIEAAHRNDVFLMEAFMYRCHPQTTKLVELLRQGAIGQVRVIQATFSFHCSFDPESRLLNNELGGGGILDVGCYCASMVRLVAGVAVGREFAEPIELTGCGHIGAQSRVDEWAVATMRFEGGVLAQLATGVQLQQDNVVRIFGSEGRIELPSPWLPSVEGGTTKILVYGKGQDQPQEIVVDSAAGLYSIEADLVAQNLEKRQAPSPAMSWDDTLGNMRALDLWRESIGLTYDAEKPEAQILPLNKRPLTPRGGHNMKYGQIPGVDKPVSRLVMGVDNQKAMPHAAVMFDDFFERGGNCFDTAWIYAGGVCQRLLGQWVKNRGIRDQVVIIDKGAHTPWCTPEGMARQLAESLERLRTDYVDIYMLHRDNLDVGVDEFIEALNDQHQAGRIRSFGASNWTLERFAAANGYARAKGLIGFAALSNNFSLARMVAPPWDGCLTSSDGEWRRWLSETQTPLMSWSSQARGFFAGRARPDDHSDPELVRCWYSDDNFQRLARAVELSEKRKVLPINIALAYVLCQPFPTFSLIGPRTLAETRSSMPALDIELTPQELAWLNLENQQR